MSLLTMNSREGQCWIPMVRRKNIHAVCCEDNYFPEGKFKLIDSLFHSVYLAFSILLFSIANLFAVRYMWDVCNENTCCVVAHIARQWLVYVRKYCVPIATESKQTLSITLFQFGRRPDNKDRYTVNQ